MTQDEELLEAWRKGDSASGHALYQRHFEPIRRFFVNKVGIEAEDLIQTTFARCTEARDRFAGRSTFRTFLFAIAHNVLREHYRRLQRNGQQVDFDQVSLADLGAGPSTVLSRRQEHARLLEALRSIPLDLQVVIELYYWERMTGAEIGEVLGVPEDTARSRIRRAKERLSKALRATPPGKRSRRGESTVHGDELDQWAAALRASGLASAV